MEDGDRCPYGFLAGKDGKLVQAVCSQGHCRLWHTGWSACSIHVNNVLQGDVAQATVDVMLLQKTLLMAQLRSMDIDPDEILRENAPLDDEEDGEEGPPEGEDDDDLPVEPTPAGAAV